MPCRQVSGRNTSRTNSPTGKAHWRMRPCQRCPDLTFTPLFYLLQEGTSGSGPGKQTPSSNCTCPRRRRNALLTKGRIFRAAIPPIKAACLIPSKLKIKGRLFRGCQPVKLQAEREGPLCVDTARWTCLASSQPEERPWAGRLVPRDCWTVPGKQEPF